MVPKGWERKALNEISDVIDCKHRTPKYVKNGIPLVSPGTIKWGAIDLESPTKRVTAEEYESLMDHCTVEYGDLVLSRNQSVGIASFVDSDKPFVLGQDTVLVKPKGSDPRFLFYNLQSTDTQKTIFKLAGGSTFSRINLGDIRKLKAIYPPFAEQQKIAKILSTWDKAINATERLIDNSTQQKKALMQQLLTGKKRLLDESGKRFDGEWEERKLSNLGSTFNGLTGKTKVDFGSGKKYIPYMNIFKNTFIDTDNLDYVNIDVDEKQNTVQFGDVFFTTSSETPEEVGMSSILLKKTKEPIYLNSFCFGFRLFEIDKVAPAFIGYILRSSHVRRKIAILAQGATRYNLSKVQLLKISIALPSLEEQQKIATVLTNADREIELLEQQLADLQQEKKALMQVLLTGKKRVVVDGDKI